MNKPHITNVRQADHVDLVMDITCPNCGQKRELRVRNDGFKAWRNGMLIQNALPELDSNDREALITGLCPACWDKITKEPEEE